MEIPRQKSGTFGKPAWTLRCRGADGSMHDHFETTRFKRKRTFDVLNLAPGTYDLFVGIRRDNFYFEDSWSGPQKSPREDASTSTGTSATALGGDQRRQSLGDDESEDSHSVENEAVVEEPAKTSMFKHVRAGIGAALHGGRKVISTVTLGKVGMLAVVLDVMVIDADGFEIVSASEQLVCGDRANYEIRFTVKDHESMVKLRVRSLSTLHSIYVFASIFTVGEEEPRLIKDTNPATGTETIVKATNSQVQVMEYDQPTRMLRRALLGSKHPERSAFARALAFACFSSWCGFTIGFFVDYSLALSVAGISLCLWFVRALIHVLVIATQ